ncbi:chemotaxis protein CheA [Flammeovirga kamogawensis]|uniref:histidine kinase n=1 Tax=Flammeovirga kamogawensis TaxID=373891 RepID=A0ABX8GRM3_9BACT|nr:chemotaxis protein CheA [Flammeovirga kamogawensis]MBB6462093.1 two-component system chemotaxis sensor kinase CheA [Flammeovirga kamogawensis]QWG05827.1 chemotaxis protein CheA [Flammeovirga kamogawensis]TRX67653.1 chemotaxis protein CheA [Flammeovirga kamogawensis]
MKEEELRQIFLAEAQDSFEELNRLFTQLEKNHGDREATEAIFRIIHTLKGNAAAMGFDDVASIGHLLEDIFSEIRKGKILLTAMVFDDLFKAIDKLGEMIEGVKENKKVPYKGLRAKLKVILRNLKGEIEFKATQGGESSEEKDKELEKEVKEELTESQKEILASEQPVPLGVNLAEEFADEEEKKSKITFSDFVQVPVSKLDDLLNLVGELAIEKDRIIAQGASFGATNEYTRLYRITSDLQYSVMGVRLVQVGALFHKFHRIIRDVATIEGKKVNLELEGTEIEIDRNVLQIISDSMIHLVRNAVSHGIESPEERRKKGKPEAGKILLRASSDKEYVIIEIIDDGNGVDATKIRKKVLEKGLASPDTLSALSDDDVVKFIFEPGFSSVENVTAVSGRGVGMDVVKKAVDAVGGKINTYTELGKGTTFSLSLPSSMAVKSALLFVVNDTEYAIPLSFTEAVISVKRSAIHKVGGGLVTTHLDDTITVMFLRDLFDCTNYDELQDAQLLHRSFDQIEDDETKINIVVVSVDNRMIGFVVDRLLQQKEIIEKPLGKPVENARFISGATILGNGNVCLVLDANDISEFLFKPAFVAV